MSQTVKKLREAAILQRSPLLHSAADEIERLMDLLRRAEREMADMYWCAEREQPPHDGDDFHELWMEIHSVLGMDTKARARAALGGEE